MQPLFLALISIITLASANVPIGQSWYLSPSSPTPSAVIPSNFTISHTILNQTEGAIASICYNFNSTLNVCVNCFATNNSNVWTDASGSYLFFSENIKAIGFQYVNTTNQTFWFQTQANPNFQSTFAAITGNWVLNDPSQHLMCYPDAFFLAPFSDQLALGALYLEYYYTSSNCSSNSTDSMGLLTSSATSDVWLTYLDDANIYFIFSGQDNLNVQLHYTNLTQALQYQRLSESIITGAWLQDWQSDRLSKSPISYEISTLTNSSVPYMVSTITDITQNASISSFVGQTLTGQYYDAFFNWTGANFSYDPSTSTLLSTEGLLLSSNGSLFSSDPFIGNWSQPTIYSGQCCTPTSVLITKTGTSQSSLQISYYLPSDFSTTAECQGLIDDAFNNQITSDLYIAAPGISKLTWTDALGTQITLEEDKIIINGFPSGCSFSMALQQDDNSLQGTWFFAWQNPQPNICIPSRFTIDRVGQGFYSIYYTYSSQDEQDSSTCQQIVATTYISQNSSTGIWTDYYGQQLNYSNTSQAIAFALPDTTEWFWFQLADSGIPLESSLVTLGGNWIDPQPVSISDTCSPPDSFFIAPSYNQTIQGQLICTATSPLDITNQPLYILSTDLLTITWTDSLTSPSLYLVFSPFTPAWQLTVTLPGTSCSYSYKRSSNYSLISGSWKQDWQSSAVFPDQPNILYQITPVSSSYPSYMNSLITSVQNQTSYVIQNPQGQYYDTYFNGTGTIFTYDLTTNSFLNTEGLLLSPNGSLFNITSFIGNWTNPQMTNSEAPFPGDCCMPNFVSISDDGTSASLLQIKYYLPSGYSNYPGCQDFTDSIKDYQITSTLYIAKPSTVQLTWADEIGPQVAFADPSSTTQLIISGFSTTCSFTMSLQATPPPPPAPLSANLMSAKVLALMLGLLTVMNL